MKMGIELLNKIYGFEGEKFKLSFFMSLNDMCAWLQEHSDMSAPILEYAKCFMDSSRKWNMYAFQHKNGYEYEIFYELNEVEKLALFKIEKFVLEKFDLSPHVSKGVTTVSRPLFDLPSWDTTVVRETDVLPISFF